MAVLEISQLCGFMVDMWTSIISWFNFIIGNYAWAIILLTVVIKLVMIPLDFFNKKVTRKNAAMQAKIQPELEKVKQRYGNDKNLYNQKINETYQKHGYNVVGSCLFMLVNMALTLTIFITLFNGLNAMASTKIIGQYDTLKQTYQTAYTDCYNVNSDEALAIEYANNEVKVKYDQIKDNWLWIDNVWKADMPTKSIPTFSEYLKIAGTVKIDDQDVKANKLTDEQKATLEAEYEQVMGPLRDNSRSANGYIVLPILILVSAFLSQWLTTRKQNKQNKQKQKDGQPNPMASSNKIMMFILPAMLAFFAFSYNAVFALYLLVSQLFTLATTPLIDLIIDKVEVLEEKRKNKKVTVETLNYSRDNTKVYQEAEKQGQKTLANENKKTSSKNNKKNKKTTQSKDEQLPVDSDLKQDKSVKNKDNKKVKEVTDKNQNDMADNETDESQKSDETKSDDKENQDLKQNKSDNN